MIHDDYYHIYPVNTYLLYRLDGLACDDG